MTDLTETDKRALRLAAEMAIDAYNRSEQHVLAMAPGSAKAEKEANRNRSRIGNLMEAMRKIGIEVEPK